jgi:hypothetical protein
MSGGAFFNCVAFNDEGLSYTTDRAQLKTAKTWRQLFQCAVSGHETYPHRALHVYLATQENYSNLMLIGIALGAVHRIGDPGYYEQSYHGVRWICLFLIGSLNNCL